MATDRFDRLTRTVSLLVSRRSVTGALGFGAIAIPGLAEGRKKRKKDKKIKRNAFGCVNVGSFCKNSGQCCSGICQGKKRKKTCQAHGQSTCQAGQQQLECNADGENEPCGAADGTKARCNTTTGNAAYCSTNVTCFACQRDTDCVQICGQEAACIQCGLLCSESGGTACAGTTEIACFL